MGSRERKRDRFRDVSFALRPVTYVYVRVLQLLCRNKFLFCSDKKIVILTAVSCLFCAHHTVEFLVVVIRWAGQTSSTANSFDVIEQGTISISGY